MKNIILTLSIFFPLLVQAQFQFGVTSSYNIAKSNSTDYLIPLNRQNVYKIKFEDHSNTRSIGLASRSTFKNIFAAIEVTYRKNKYQIMVEDFRENKIIPIGGKQFTESTECIHIPISAGINFGSTSIALGPYFNYTLNSNAPIAASTEIKNTERKLSAGFHFDVGYDIRNHFKIFIRYEKAFADVGNLYAFNSKKIKLDSHMNYISIGGCIYV